MVDSVTVDRSGCRSHCFIANLRFTINHVEERSRSSRMVLYTYFQAVTKEFRICSKADHVKYRGVRQSPLCGTVLGTVFPSTCPASGWLNEMGYALYRQCCHEQMMQLADASQCWYIYSIRRCRQRHGGSEVPDESCKPQELPMYVCAGLCIPQSNVAWCRPEFFALISASTSAAYECGPVSHRR